MTLRARRCIAFSTAAAFVLVITWILAQLFVASYVTVNSARQSLHERPVVHTDGVTSVPTTPTEAEVIGLVFYGRREFVRVLDCYLKVCKLCPQPTP